MAFKFQVVLACLLVVLTQPCARSSSDKYDAREVGNKSQVGILRLRGFKAEVHYAITRDGYHLNLVRIINPFVKPGSALKRPVLFNHGLIESSTIWLVNSRNVTARKPDNLCAWSDEERGQDGDEMRNAAMMLANHGYDVWLLSMRGTDWSLYHEIMDRSNPDFWDYSLDQFAQDDVPTAIDYVRRVTNAPKVAYVGHSQATFSIFGLLSTKPHYARIVEPVFAIAPVAYFHRITSVARVAFLALLDKPIHENGPLPESAKQMRQALASICSDDKHKFGCNLVETLIGGNSGGKEWPSGYYSHVPYFTSLKVMRHFGQLIRTKKFTMYDHGPTGNMARYGQLTAPLYKPEQIESRSLVLVWTRADVISTSDDVRQFINELKVPLYRNIHIDRDLDHFDMITHDDAAQLVNRPMLEIIEDFEQRDGLCAKFQWPAVGADTSPIAAVGSTKVGSFGGGKTNKFGGAGKQNKGLGLRKKKQKQHRLDSNSLFDWDSSFKDNSLGFGSWSNES